MKKFLQRLALFMLFSIILTLISLTFIAPQYTHNYDASILDKIARLESTPSPKIILVGNSNVAFGFNSSMIEKAFNMGVVNLGLHGSLGNRFLEEMSKYNIGKGDIVVVCHSDYCDDGKIADHSLAWITVENHCHLWPLISHDVPQMVEDLPPYVLRIWTRWCTKADKRSDNCYAREAFNEYGDNAYPRPCSEYVFEATDVSVPKINSYCTNRLNDFNRYCLERGATMVVAGYPVADGEYTPDEAQFIERWDELKRMLDCPIISNIADYFFPYSDFYNSSLHLNDSAVMRRTQQFISDLKRAGIAQQE